MGMMSQILQGEKKTAVAVAEPKPAAADVNQVCPICGCPDLWESIYADGVLRCDLCEPAPTPSIVGRRIGLAAAELELAEQGSTEDLPLGTDPADRYVEYVTADGRTGVVLRGYDNVHGANYNQRICAYVAIGVERYEQALDAMQEQWRREIFGAKPLQKR